MKDEGENKNKEFQENSNRSEAFTNLNNGEIDEYQKYKINDETISSISFEEIDEKVNRLIKLKKENSSKFEEMKENNSRIEQEMREKGEKIKEKKSRIKQGCIQLTNYIIKKNKRKFWIKVKQKIEALLIIYKSLIWFEKLLAKIKLIYYKRCFVKILKRNKAKKNKKRKGNIKNGKKSEEKKLNSFSPKKENINNINNLNNINNINLIQKKYQNESFFKANIKLKKLELKKKRENEYIRMIENQRRRKQEIIQNIDTNIKEKNKKLEQSINNNSLPESLISSEKDMSLANISLDSNVENGLEILVFLISNYILNNKLIFFYTLLEKFIPKKNKKTKISKGKKYHTKYSRKYSKKKFDEKKFDRNINKSYTIIELGRDDSESEGDNYMLNKDSVYNKKVDKSQLVEYDLFYKEQFFKNEVFLYDVENIEDKVEAEIEKEMSRLDVKRKLIEKKKLKEVNDLKKLDTTELQAEIEKLQKTYQKFKEKEEPKVELELNNTEGFLHNGRMLGVYFQEIEEINFPRFAMESVEDIGAKEVIDFKILRKEEVARRYYDYCCCLEERKKLNKILVYSRYYCRFFVDNWIFDNLSLLIIITNTILILISDPTDPNNIGNKSDKYFLFFYTIEAVLKIISFRFISAEDAYIKDYWNILDFFVVIVGWISFVLERVMNGKKISGLAGLRAFRILRPLKTVKRFKGLKKLVTALLASIGHLGETTIVLFFFFLIFSIAGTQMWQGIFYRRCMSVNYGYLVSTQGDTGMCYFDSDCEEYNSYGNTFICAKGYRNPNSGAVNFDNTLTGFITVFVMVTLEGWTDFFTYVNKTFKDKIYINNIIIFCYFHVFVFVAAFYLINLFLAVTNSEFEHIEVSRKQLKEKKSLFKLIQGKYDLKEREKKEKKEKERQLKINNNKKSDETLRELYYKITDEAYHIHKNKKNIPIMYSTAKDMYIMTNKNPEDLYLQTLQIDEENNFLSKDIKRQQKEIDALIKKKKNEDKKDISIIKPEETKEKEKEKKTQVNKLNKNFETIANKKQSFTNTKKTRFKTLDPLKYSKSVIAEKTSNEEMKEEEPKSSTFQNNIENIKKLKKIMGNIIADAIENSIDTTLAFIKEKKNEMEKKSGKGQSKRKRKSEIKKDKENDIDVNLFEDLPYEKLEKEIEKRKRDKEKIKKLKKEKSNLEEEKLQKSVRLMESNIGGISGNKACRNLDRKLTFVEKDPSKKKVKLPEQLSIINDLGLSDVEENLDKKQLLKIKKQHMNHKNLVKQKSLKLLNNVSERDKDENSNLDKSLISKDNDSSFQVLRERKVLYDVQNNFNVETQFMKPYSLMDFLNRQRKENLNEKRLKYIEKKYEMRNDTNKSKDKNNERELIHHDSEFSLSKIHNNNNDQSFLNFVDIIHKKESMDIIFKNQNENANSNKDDNDNITELNKSYTKSLLEDQDSIISFYDDVSLEDINLLPDKIDCKKVFGVDYLQNENIRKNLVLNKLTQNIRSSFFDRQAVNTEINLTTQQQSNHFNEMNKKLNELLFVDTKKIRGRYNKNHDLDVSHVASERNYDKFLEHTDEEQESSKKKHVEINLNIKNLKSNPLREIMHGYNEKVEGDAEYDIENPRKNEMKKKYEEKEEKDINLMIKKVSSERINREGEDFINSEANLLGPKKSSERIDLNKEQMKKEKDQKEDLMKKSQSKSSNNNNPSNKSLTKLSYFKKLRERARKKKEKEKMEKILNQKTYNVGSKKGTFFIFKAKSIDKNIIKYPQENSKDFQIKEENKIYTDPLTVEQELIPDNLRGKKFYMNYLYNIADKDLKVKDNFKVDHWEKEILGRKEKTFKKKPLPENTEAFFVFNDKKLNLLKYTYMQHKDIEYSQKDISILTHDLKYLPLNVLEIMPSKLRNFGKYIVGKEINHGHLGKNPTSMGSHIYKIQNNTRSGKTSVMKPRNTTKIITSSSFLEHKKYQEEIMFRRNVFERIFKKIDEFNYRTLSHYFLIEDNLYFQLIDAKRKEELIQKIINRNREKENRIEAKDELQNILEFDLKTNSHRYIKWSGSDILCHKNEDDERKKWNKIISSLEDFNMIIWNKNVWIQRFQKLRYAFYVLATNDYFDFIILSIVIINSVFMALDGNILKPEIFQKLEISNYVFNSIFILEYLVKFIGLGPLVYYSDAFTYLDTLIIAFAILDMATPNEDTGTASKDKVRNVSSQLSFLRVFRIFRVIRLTKVLRRLKSMRLIIVSIKKALSNVSYIICILIMFILIFQLLGMSLLSGNYHYQSFFIGFYTTYQILTLENWNSLFYEIWPMNYFCFFYFVAWIFLGNYVIFNLFISILLQSFDEEEKEDEDDLSYDEKVEKMYLLPAYLNMIKKSAFSHKTKKLKAYRKKFDKNEIGGEEQESKESIDETKDFSEYKITNSYLGSFSKSYSKSNYKSSVNENTSYDVSRSMDPKSKEEEIDDDDNNYCPSEIASKMNYWKKVNILFAENECENSVYLLSQTNSFRIFCMKLIINKWFDRFILIMILFSTARLVIDTFVSGYLFVLGFDILDAIFNIIFFLECLAKVFAMGFTLDEGSYLRDNWNKIDIIIVICSIFDFQNLFTKYFTTGTGNSSVQFLKVIRLLRTLRPLRFISHNVQLKLIITSLFDSILPICNALFIVIVVYYMFSIVGISLFYSGMHNCYILNSEGYFDLAITKFKDILVDYEVPDDMVSISNFCSQRYNGIMDTGPAFKFSNIATSFITSYVLSTMEGWPDIMYSYTIYESYYGIYFIVSNLVVAYFFLNLFTGILFKYFNEAYKKEQKMAEDDKKAPKYYDFLTQICDAETHYVVWKRPKKGSYSYYLREIADSALLDNIIMIVIFLNMIFMALNFEGSSSGWNTFLTIVNYVFTGIFILECIVKLLGLGFAAYFHSGWNRFDFFVVFASIVDLAVANVEGFDASFLKSFQIIRVLRVLRITRVLRLIKALKGLEKLIQTLSWSLTALANVLLLMLIFFCIFAILGCYFYDSIMYNDYKDEFVYINEYYNMDNFYNSFLLVFRCATGENWNNIMMELAFIDTDKVSEVYAYVYFIVSNFANSIIMLNLFLMVTLQQYDEFTNKNYNPIEKFESFLIDFNNAWNKFADDEDKGFRIKKVYVTQFFMDFNWKKLNFPEQGKLETVKKYVTELKLTTDDDDFVYYHDVIYKIINRQMGSLIDRSNKDNKLIFKKEAKVEKKIKSMINRYIRKKGKNKVKKPKHILITFNPLTSHLYFKLSYLYLKNFIKNYKDNCELLKNIEEYSPRTNN